MDKNLEERMSEIAARIEETRRIRRGLYAHLGERVFNQVVADPDLRNGKEEILGAIAACNRELGRLEDASASLDARMFAASQVGESAVSPATGAASEPAAEPAPSPGVEEPAHVSSDAPVVVAPLEPLSPVVAPEPVALEPVSYDAVPEAGPGAPTVTSARVAGEGDADASSLTAGAMAGVVAFAPDGGEAAGASGSVDGAAPTIVLDRGGESHGGPEPETADAAEGAIGQSDSSDSCDRRTCPVCGAAVAADHRFCMNCGYRLDD